MDSEQECVPESRHGRYARTTVRYQLAIHQDLRDAIKARAGVDGVADADVVRAALRKYLRYKGPVL